MQQFTMREHGRLDRSEIKPKLARDLQKFDEQHATKTGETVFDWSHLLCIKAKSLVGVVQIPGLLIEILPKIDDTTREESRGDMSNRQSRNNLLFMLSQSGRLPLHERDLASQKLQKLPLLEALIWVFAQRLLSELRRGQQHLYVYREENLNVVRGRILINRQVTQNIGHRHRIFVGYDEFLNDTWLNRILKAACNTLLSMTRVPATQQHLREGILELADVEDRIIEARHFGLVEMNRNSERFRELLGFCELLFHRAAPSLHAGEASSFSLLFPMEVLFEEFIGSVLRRYAGRFGFSQSDVHLQARSRRRWLLRDEQQSGRFRLKPDVLIDGPAEQPVLILDTKWKRLLSDDEDSKNGVAHSDMYQLYAYSQRYDCANNVLLFPLIPGATPHTYSLDGDESEKRLIVSFIDLSYDLRREFDRLVEDLRRVIGNPGASSL